jgi:NAD(P)H-flavin reductase
MKLKDLEIKYPGLTQLIKDIKVSPMGNNNVVKFTHSKLPLYFEVQIDAYYDDDIQWSPIAAKIIGNNGKKVNISDNVYQDFYDELISEEPTLVEIAGEFKHIHQTIKYFEEEHKITLEYEYDSDDKTHTFEIYTNDHYSANYIVTIKGSKIDIEDRSNDIYDDKVKTLKTLEEKVASLKQELYGDEWIDEDDIYEDWLQDDDDESEYYDDLDDDYGDK